MSAEILNQKDLHFGSQLTQRLQYPFIEFPEIIGGILLTEGDWSLRDYNSLRVVAFRVVRLGVCCSGLEVGSQ